MRRVELAGGDAFLAPTLDELAVLGEFHDARVGFSAMSVGDKNIAVGRDDDIGGRVESVLAVAGESRLAERQQYFSVTAKLEDLMSFAVFTQAIGHPHIAVLVHRDAVGKDEEARAEAS